MTRKFIIFLLSFVSAFFQVAKAQEIITTQSIDWSSFLKQHDLVWDSIPANYYAGAITGNGLLGSIFYKEGNGYKLSIGRIDVTEDRMPNDKSKYRNLYDGARLPIGYFMLTPRGNIVDENMRLALWDATNTGDINTDVGKISFTNFTHATKNVIVFEVNTDGDESNFLWEWIPLKAESPRLTFGYNDYSEEYIANPNPEVKFLKDGDYNYSIQNLFNGKTYVVAWRKIDYGKGNSEVFITISQDNSEHLAMEDARKTLDEVITESLGKLKKTHLEWWHNYFPSSFITFDNTKMESFYWIQQYKFGCLTRHDKKIIDLIGPWAVNNTPWPAIWMNLNIQLTYSPLFTANRAELSEPVWRTINENLDNLSDNVVVKEWKEDSMVLGRSSSYHLYAPLSLEMENKLLYEVGNLTWLLFYYYQYCNYLQDENELLDKFYPLLKKSIAYYEHIREKREDGKYHLPETASPEYKSAKNTNYDLSLLTWGLETLIGLNKKYNINDNKINDWLDFKDNLTYYQIDDTKGFMIGEDVNLDSSHRHYSHLLMIYPLFLINWDQPENHELISKSIEHWQSMTQYLQGYSFTGSSSMYASMGDGERAVGQLQKLLDDFIQPNTLYKETGPVIETPLAGASSLQDLYLQSWDGKIRVFPAVPREWENASFISLRANGGFLISALRDNGKSVFVQIESEKGGECLIQTMMNLDKVSLENLYGKQSNFSVIDKNTGLIKFNMEKGDIIMIADVDSKSITPQPIIHQHKDLNQYGMKKVSN